MIRWMYTLLFLAASFALSAQAASPELPMLRYHPAVLRYGYYTLGAQRVTEQEVLTHFAQTNGQALSLFKQGQRMNDRGVKLIYIAAGGGLLALLTNNREVQLAGLGTMYLSGGIGVGLTIFSNRKMGQALNRYNWDAGY